MPPTNTTSQTVTETNEVRPILRLRNDATAPRPAARSRPVVQWEEDVVDNEDLNRKKSKICCIFHPQREFGELSDLSSDSSSDDSDVDADADANADPEKQNDPQEDDCCGHKHKHKAKKKKKASPNAYEKQPHYTNQSKVPEKAENWAVQKNWGE